MLRTYAEISLIIKKSTGPNKRYETIFVKPANFLYFFRDFKVQQYRILMALK